MTRQTIVASQPLAHAGGMGRLLRRVRVAGLSVLRRSVMAVWVISPLLPAIGAAISWYLGL